MMAVLNSEFYKQYFLCARNNYHIQKFVGNSRSPLGASASAEAFYAGRLREVLTPVVLRTGSSTGFAATVSLGFTYTRQRPY